MLQLKPDKRLVVLGTCLLSALLCSGCYPPTELDRSLDSKGPGSVRAAYSVNSPVLQLRPIGSATTAAYGELRWQGSFMLVSQTTNLPVRIEDAFNTGWSQADPLNGEYTRQLLFSKLPHDSYRLVSGRIDRWADTGYGLVEYCSAPAFFLNDDRQYDAGSLVLDTRSGTDDRRLSGRVYLEGPFIVSGRSAVMSVSPDYWSLADTEPAPGYPGGFSLAIPAAGVREGRALFEISRLPRRPVTLADLEPWNTELHAGGLPPQLDLTTQEDVSGLHCLVTMYRDEARLHENSNSFRVKLQLDGATDWAGDLAISVHRVDGSTDLFAEDRHWLFPAMLAAGADPRLHEYNTGELETNDYRFEARLYDPAGPEYIELPLTGGPFLLPSGWQNSQDHSDPRPQVNLTLAITAQQAAYYSPAAD